MYGDEEGWVLCSGHYNIVHKNHVELFKYASTLGPVVVGINCDEVNTKKNGSRAVPAADRAYVLNSIRYVREVVIFTEPNPSELILHLRPRYLVKGPDYRDKYLPEEAACLIAGTQILFRPGTYQYSSKVLTAP